MTKFAAWNTQSLKTKPFLIKYSAYKSAKGNKVKFCAVDFNAY